MAHPNLEKLNSIKMFLNKKQVSCLFGACQHYLGYHNLKVMNVTYQNLGYEHFITLDVEECEYVYDEIIYGNSKTSTKSIKIHLNEKQLYLVSSCSRWVVTINAIRYQSPRTLEKKKAKYLLESKMREAQLVQKQYEKEIQELEKAYKHIV